MKHFAFMLLAFYGSIAHGQVTDFCATNFSRADSIAESYAAHPLTDLNALANKLTSTLPTEQEKFRAIYQWVCSNIEADYALVLRNRHNRSKLEGAQLVRWNKKFNKMVFETLRNEHKTVCTGYAYLVRELAFHAGLTCEIVNGYAKHAGINQNTVGPVNHSWNRIQLNGKWYVCDATWSSGVFNLNANRFIKKYDNRYFLMEPSLFYQSHCDAAAIQVTGMDKEH